MAQMSRNTPNSEMALDREKISDQLLTAEEVARVVGLSTETLAQWRSQRRGIPFIKISRNCVRYRQFDLDTFLAERIVRVEQDSSDARR
jgi:hypothetical protein